MDDQFVAHAFLRHLPARSVALLGGSCRSARNATRHENIWELLCGRLFAALIKRGEPGDQAAARRMRARTRESVVSDLAFRSTLAFPKAQEGADGRIEGCQPQDADDMLAPEPAWRRGLSPIPLPPLPHSSQRWDDATARLPVNLGFRSRSKHQPRAVSGPQFGREHVCDAGAATTGGSLGRTRLMTQQSCICCQTSMIGQLLRSPVGAITRCAGW